MPGDPHTPTLRNCAATTGPMSRRTFGQTIGAAAVGSTLQAAFFGVTLPYPTQISGTPMTTYIDWMRSCWYVTFMSNPAISVPGGFTTSGLPVGVQIVGRHRDDWSVLQLAHAFEQATQYGKRRPRVVTV